MPARSGIRIGEVARRAGVPVSTIKYYLREGLLPDPISKGRNTAWYSEETVERVLLSRELQEKAFVPLKVVGEIFERTTDPVEIRRYLRAPGGVKPALSPDRFPVSDFLGSEGFSAEEWARLEELGLVSAQGDGAEASLDRFDAKLVRVLLRMRDLGLTPERGFRAEQVAVYQRALEVLARQEISLALKGLVGRVSPGEIQPVAEEILDAASELVSIIHRKAVARLLGEIGSAQ